MSLGESWRPTPRGAARHAPGTDIAWWGMCCEVCNLSFRTCSSSTSLSAISAWCWVRESVCAFVVRAGKGVGGGASTCRFALALATLRCRPSPCGVVWERKREGARPREGGCVCTCVCVWECACACVWCGVWCATCPFARVLASLRGWPSASGVVCVREQERKRRGERESVCVCVRVYLSVCV